MPAVLVEVGFINSDTDNKIFDENFNEIARAIADGILETVYSQTTKTDAPDTGSSPDIPANYSMPASPGISENHGMPACRCDEEGTKLYRIQTGAYRNKENADRMLDSLLIEGFPAFIISDDGYYKVQVGAFLYLTNAIKMEQRLRRFRYNTYIVYD